MTKEIEVNLRTVRRSELEKRYTIYPKKIIDIRDTSGLTYPKVCVVQTYLEHSGYLVSIRSNIEFNPKKHSDSKVKKEILADLVGTIEKIKKYYKPSSTVIDLLGDSIDIKIIEDE